MVACMFVGVYKAMQCKYAYYVHNYSTVHGKGNVNRKTITVIVVQQ